MYKSGKKLQFKVGRGKLKFEMGKLKGERGKWKVEIVKIDTIANDC